MTRPEGGGPAFPSSPNPDEDIDREGMTLRDWFAGQALAGLASLEDLNETQTAAWAYSVADAMLVARNKKEEV